MRQCGTFVTLHHLTKTALVAICLVQIWQYSGYKINFSSVIDDFSFILNKLSVLISISKFLKFNITK